MLDVDVDVEFRAYAFPACPFSAASLCRPILPVSIGLQLLSGTFRHFQAPCLQFAARLHCLRRLHDLIHFSVRSSCFQKFSDISVLTSFNRVMCGNPTLEVRESTLEVRETGWKCGSRPVNAKAWPVHAETDSGMPKATPGYPNRLGLATRLTK